MSKQVLIEELAWAVIALLVFMVATGTIFWLGVSQCDHNRRSHLEVAGQVSFNSCGNAASGK